MSEGDMTDDIIEGTDEAVQPDDLDADTDADPQPAQAGETDPEAEAPAGVEP